MTKQSADHILLPQTKEMKKSRELVRYLTSSLEMILNNINFISVYTAQIMVK